MTMAAKLCCTHGVVFLYVSVVLVSAKLSRHSMDAICEWSSVDAAAMSGKRRDICSTSKHMAFFADGTEGTDSLLLSGASSRNAQLELDKTVLTRDKKLDVTVEDSNEEGPKLKISTADDGGDNSDDDLDDVVDESDDGRETHIGTASSGAPDDDGDEGGGIEVDDSLPETHEYNSDDEDGDEYELNTYSEREQDAIHELKNIWQAHIQRPPSRDTLQKRMQEACMVYSTMLGGHRTNKNTLYRLFLREMIDSSNLTPGKEWLDRDVVVQLKGSAALSHNPQLLSHTSHLPRVTRGIRLVTPRATHAMQETLANALAHSLGVNLVHISERVFESVRRTAISKGLPRKLLTRHSMLSALLDMAEEEQEPYIVVLCNRGGSVFTSEAASEVILEEMKNPSSRVFFVLTSVSDNLGAGTSGLQTSSTPQNIQLPHFPRPHPSVQNLNLVLHGGSFGRNGTQFRIASSPGVTPGGTPSPPPAVIQKLVREMMEKMQQDGGQTPGNMKDMKLRPAADEQQSPTGPNIPPELAEFLEDALKDGSLAQGIQDSLNQMMPLLEQSMGAGPNGSLRCQISIFGQMPGPPMGGPPPGPLGGVPALQGPSSLPAWFSALRSRRSAADTTSPALPHAEADRDQKDAQQNSQTGSSRALLAQFEDVIVPPPRDHALKAQWDKMVDDDVRRHTIRRNRQTLQNALRVSGLVCVDLKRLIPLLSRQLLSDDELSTVLLAALKVDAARAHTRYSPQSVSMTTLADGTLQISAYALEVAIAQVCKGIIPRIGRPMGRTKEEVASLAQDKHERALVANVISPQDIGVTYDMIGGLQDVKELLRQCITYPLKYPHLYSEGIASEAVRGVLLFGPPGTGKTMLAKAVATEGGATFLSVDASSIENKWLGESEKNAKAVFTLARRLAPCVIYLDEVDSVLSSREHGDDSSHGTLTSVKTTIMQEWDGLRTTTDRVVVIASTNRPFDLDEAVLRRLPRRIMVDLPDLTTRKNILEVSMQNNRIATDVNFTRIAEQLEGYTGSDIKEVCREAVVRIAHEQATKYELGGEIDMSAHLRPVNATDFESALQRLRASVNEKGRELARVWEWNDKFGEMKRKHTQTHLSMYL